MPAVAEVFVPTWFLWAVVALLATIAVSSVLVLAVLRTVATELNLRTSLSDKLQPLLDKGDLEAVIEQSKVRLQTFPDDANAHYFLGLALHRDGQSRLALAHLKRVPELQAGWDVSTLISAVEHAALLNEKPADLRLVKESHPPRAERGDA
jgi:cytochrome c-type biogenesis protein CcmH/NrfG